MKAYAIVTTNGNAVTIRTGYNNKSLAVFYSQIEAAKVLVDIGKEGYEIVQVEILKS